MIAGYELKWQVEDMLAALEHEKLGARNARHLEAIDAQIEMFKAELERMEATGEGGEPVTLNPAMGTTAYWGVPGVDRGRII